MTTLGVCKITFIDIATLIRQNVQGQARPRTFLNCDLSCNQTLNLTVLDFGLSEWKPGLFDSFGTPDDYGDPG